MCKAPTGSVAVLQCLAAAASARADDTLQLLAEQVNSFGELLTLRIGFAMAQATQNPVCFSLIPELFPRERSTAMAAYNAAIYMGRALSFAAVILADQLGIPTGDIGVTMVRRPWAGAGYSARAQERWPYGRPQGYALAPCRCSQQWGRYSQHAESSHGLLGT